MPLSKQTTKHLENLRDSLLDIIKNGVPADKSDEKSPNSQELQREAGVHFGIIVETCFNAEKIDKLSSQVLQSLRHIMDRFSDHPTIFLLAYEVYYQNDETLETMPMVDCLHAIDCYDHYLRTTTLKPGEIAAVLESQYRCQTSLLSRFEKSDKKLQGYRLFDIGSLLLNECGKKNPFYTGVANHLEKAESIFKMIKADHIHARKFGLALVLFHKGNFKEALDMFKDIDKDRLPPTANYHSLLGRCYVANGDLLWALKAFEVGAQLRDIDCTVRLARLLIQLGQAEKGSQLLRAHASIDKDSALEYYYLCRDGKVPQEDANSAYPYLEKAKNMGNPEAMHEMGLLYEKEEKYEEAIKCYEVAKRFNHLASIRRLSHLYAHVEEVFDIDEANVNYELAARKNDTMARIYVADALWYGKYGFDIDKPESMIHYDLAISNLLEDLKNKNKSYEDIAAIHYLLATLYASEYKNNLREALRECQLAVKYKHPNAGKFKTQLIQKIQLINKENQKSEPDTEQESEEIEAIEEKPLTIDDMTAVAYKAQKEEKYADAITQWKKILKLHYTPIMRIKCIYSIAYNYLLWSKQNNAPANALSRAQRKYEKILALLLIALNHPKTTDIELDELEFWHQSILEEAALFKMSINKEEYRVRAEVVNIDSSPSIPSSDVTEQPSQHEKRIKRKPGYVTLSPAAIYVHDTLKKHGHRALIVGGAVRDELLKQQQKDFDFITKCPLTTLLTLFPGEAEIVGKHHSIVIVHHCGERIEIGNYQSILIDHANRDFTINSLCYDVDNKEFVVVDNSDIDFEKKQIKTIADPCQSFREDPARILRAINLKSKTAFQIEPQTEKALIDNIKELKKLPPERLFHEILKLLINKNNALNIKFLHQYKILTTLFPLSTTAMTDKSHTHHHSIQAVLTDAANPEKVMDSALLLAVILWPSLEMTLKNRARNIEDLEKAMNNVLDIQCKNVLIPENLHKKIRCLWRTYLIMKNIYPGSPKLKSVHYKDFLLSEQFFQYLNGRKFNLSRAKHHKANEVVLLQYTTPMKKLIRAIDSHNLEAVLTFTRQYADMHLRSPLKACWLHVAALGGHLKILEIFINDANINSTDINMRTPLHYAVCKGHLAIVERLLDAGAIAEFSDKDGATILHMAAECGHYEIIQLVIERFPNLLKQLNLAGQSALHTAVIHRQYHLVKLLSEHIDTEMKDKSGSRAVDIAVNDEKYNALPGIINVSKNPVTIPERIPLNVLKKCRFSLLSGLKDSVSALLIKHAQENRLFVQASIKADTTQNVGVLKI